MTTQEDKLESVIRYLSTSSNPALLFGKVLKPVVGEDHLFWIDPLDPAIMAFFALRRSIETIYFQSVPVTTLSQQVYRTTSLWWLIVGCSDYIHPHQIPNDTKIMVPALIDIVPLVQKKLLQSNQGKVVTF